MPRSCDCLAQHRGDILVIAGLGAPNWDVSAAGDHPNNFPLWGAMGAASMMGLGLALAQPKRKLTTVAPGASVIDESDPTKPVFTAPDKADKPPSAVQEYQFAKSQGYQGTFEDWSLSQWRAVNSSATRGRRACRPVVTCTSRPSKTAGSSTRAPGYNHPGSAGPTG